MAWRSPRVPQHTGSALRGMSHLGTSLSEALTSLRTAEEAPHVCVTQTPSSAHSRYSTGAYCLAQIQIQASSSPARSSQPQTHLNATLTPAQAQSTTLAGCFLAMGNLITSHSTSNSLCMEPYYVPVAACITAPSVWALGRKGGKDRTGS